MRLRWISYAFAHTRAFKTALAVTFCVSLTAAAETKTRTYNQDFELDRSNFSYPLCPEGSIWSTWNNSLESQALWNKEWAFARDATLDHVHFDDKQGVFMNINKTAASESR